MATVVGSHRMSTSKKRPSIPRATIGFVNDPQDWPSQAISSLTGKIWTGLYLPSRRTGKRPGSSRFTLLHRVYGLILLLCVFGFAPLHFARPLCVAAGLSRCSVFSGLPGASSSVCEGGAFLLLPRWRTSPQIHCNVSNQEKVITVTHSCHRRDEYIPGPRSSC